MVGRQAPVGQHRSPRSEQRITNQLPATILFTVLEVWALIVALLFLHPGGVARVALALVLATGVVVVADAWRAVRAARRADQ
jgi:hypothetical protein